MAAVDHVAARLETHLAHAQIVGTQRAAKPAQRAAVDHPVGLAVAEHDAEIVVDVAHVALRIRAVVLQVLAGLDAFEAMAGEAAARFGDRLVAAVAALGRSRHDRGNGRVRSDVDVKARAAARLVGPARGQRRALQQTVDRERSPPPIGRRADRRIGRAAAARAEHLGVAGEQRSRVDGEGAVGREFEVADKIAGRVRANGDKHGVMIGDQRRQRRAAGCAHARPALYPHPERDQSRDVGVDGRGRQVVRIAGGKARQRPVLRLEHRRRAPFHREVEGGREAGQSGADDRDPLGLARRLRRAADRGVGLADHHAFERRNTDRSARLVPAAGGFARVIADPAEHCRQRDGTRVDRAGGGEVAGLDLFDHRAGVDVQRAGRRAGGRPLLDAAGFPLVDVLAVHRAGL